MFVSTILFPISVLLLMGRLTVNDVFPIFATSTEDKAVESLSDPNVEVGRFSKNPGRQGCFRIVCLFLLYPYLRQGFGSKRVQCLRFSSLRT